jgi:hypothetical protein
MRGWYFDPHSGGTSIPNKVREETRARILRYSEQQGLLKRHKIEVRFNGHFCYIDALEDGEKIVTHLCRLRYSGGIKNWSLAFYTYSNEKYVPCVFESGDWFGTPEEALKISAMYLT